MNKAACILCVNDEGLILAVSRKDDPDSFGLPGGKVDEGEDYKDAAIRELQEETGFSVHGSLEEIYAADVYGEDGMDYHVVTFLAEGVTVKPVALVSPEETGVVEWVKPSVLVEGSFPEYNLSLFEAAGIECNSLGLLLAYEKSKKKKHLKRSQKLTELENLVESLLKD